MGRRKHSLKKATSDHDGSNGLWFLARRAKIVCEDDDENPPVAYPMANPLSGVFPARPDHPTRESMTLKSVLDPSTDDQCHQSIGRRCVETIDSSVEVYTTQIHGHSIRPDRITRHALSPPI